MVRHLGRMRLSFELLADMLFPDGAKIVRVHEPCDGYTPEQVEIVVEHPDLPAVEEGGQIRVVVPQYERSGHRDGTLVLTELCFTDWGL